MITDDSWPGTLSTSLQQLDQQHKHITILLRKVDHAVTSLDPETLEHLVIELLDFIVSHNHLEDRLMEESGYPHAAEHQAAHQLFTCAVEGYMQQITCGMNTFRMARQIRQEVGQWLEAHLIYEDQAWTDYLKAQQQPTSHRIRKAVGKLFSL